jgi:hypothetical protein
MEQTTSGSVCAFMAASRCSTRGIASIGRTGTCAKPATQGFDALRWAVLGDTPLRSALTGKSDVIAAASHEDVLRRHTETVTRSTARIVIAGDVDASDTGAAVETRMADLPAGRSNALAVPTADVSAQAWLTAKDPVAATASAHMALFDGQDPVDILSTTAGLDRVTDTTLWAHTGSVLSTEVQLIRLAVSPVAATQPGVCAITAPFDAATCRCVTATTSAAARSRVSGSPRPLNVTPQDGECVCPAICRQPIGLVASFVLSPQRSAVRSRPFRPNTVLRPDHPKRPSQAIPSTG